MFGDFEVAFQQRLLHSDCSYRQSLSIALATPRWLEDAGLRAVVDIGQAGHAPLSDGAHMIDHKSERHHALLTRQPVLALGIAGDHGLSDLGDACQDSPAA